VLIPNSGADHSQKSDIGRESRARRTFQKEIQKRPARGEGFASHLSLRVRPRSPLGFRGSVYRRARRERTTAEGSWVTMEGSWLNRFAKSAGSLFLTPSSTSLALRPVPAASGGAIVVGRHQTNRVRLSA